MPVWYYEKKDLKSTPSIRDGVDLDTEQRYRREGCRFIYDLGLRLGLQPETMGTGAVFFHRFYMSHSFRQYPRYATATCCLFLAGKVEETPKKIRDIMKTARQILEGARERYIPTLGDERGDLILQYERILLPTVKFDFYIVSPYSFLKQYVKTIIGDKEQIRQMYQMAWTFVNDSYCTTLCLQWEPEIIAIAMLYLACKLSKYEITDWTNKKENTKQKWWEQFVDGLTKDIIEDICHQHLDLYSKDNLSSSGNGTVTNSSVMLTPTQTNSAVTSPIESPSTMRSMSSKRPRNEDDSNYRSSRNNHHHSANLNSSNTGIPINPPIPPMPSTMSYHHASSHDELSRRSLTAPPPPLPPPPLPPLPPLPPPQSNVVQPSHQNFYMRPPMAPPNMPPMPPSMFAPSLRGPMPSSNTWPPHPLPPM
ncbi:unnamed protein product [Adineta ricciae]|uniref:Cyclin-like domain-containing protein n=1 Tax=Adineta ricciae TaxID=249248 RepID=A0A814PQC7_ADIRI|nr:unnamed protein product [Adineta ricciae]